MSLMWTFVRITTALLDAIHFKDQERERERERGRGAST